MGLGVFFEKVKMASKVTSFPVSNIHRLEFYSKDTHIPIATINVLLSALLFTHSVFEPGFLREGVKWSH